MPLNRPKKLSAVRSPVKSARVCPLMPGNRAAALDLAAVIDHAGELNLGVEGL